MTEPAALHVCLHVFMRKVCMEKYCVWHFFGLNLAAKAKKVQLLLQFGLCPHADSLEARIQHYSQNANNEAFILNLLDRCTKMIG